MPILYCYKPTETYGPPSKYHHHPASEAILAALAQPLRCNAERLSPVPKWGDGDLQQGNHLKIDGRMYFMENH